MTDSSSRVLIPIITTTRQSLSELIPDHHDSEENPATDEQIIAGLIRYDRGADADALAFALGSASVLDDVTALGVTMSRRTHNGIQYLLATLNRQPVLTLYRSPVTDYPGRTQKA